MCKMVMEISILHVMISYFHMQKVGSQSGDIC